MHDLTPRKLALALTTHGRNGGGADSFLPPDTPAWTIDDGGSDTEEEDNKELQDYYSNRMSVDTERRVETVFGAGVDVWMSKGGGMHIGVDVDVGVGVKKRMEKSRKEEEEEEEDLAKKRKGEKAGFEAFSSKRSGTFKIPFFLPFVDKTSKGDQVDINTQPAHSHFADIAPRSPTRTETLQTSALRQCVVSRSFGTLQGKSLNGFDERVCRVTAVQEEEKDG